MNRSMLVLGLLISSLVGAEEPKCRNPDYLARAPYGTLSKDARGEWLLKPIDPVVIGYFENGAYKERCVSELRLKSGASIDPALLSSFVRVGIFQTDVTWTGSTPVVGAGKIAPLQYLEFGSSLAVCSSELRSDFVPWLERRRIPTPDALVELVCDVVAGNPDTAEVPSSRIVEKLEATEAEFSRFHALMRMKKNPADWQFTGRRTSVVTIGKHEFSVDYAASRFTLRVGAEYSSRISFGYTFEYDVNAARWRLSDFDADFGLECGFGRE